MFEGSFTYYIISIVCESDVIDSELVPQLLRNVLPVGFSLKIFGFPVQEFRKRREKKHNFDLDHTYAHSHVSEVMHVF